MKNEEGREEDYGQDLGYGRGKGERKKEDYE